MPRPRRLRRVNFEPDVDYFKPVGVPMRELKISTLTLEEVEALRLTNLRDLNQEDAATKMNISQPTFNRLLESARRKVTDALVNGKAIKIEGGFYAAHRERIDIPQGYCVCPACRYRVQKIRGVPCYTRSCPKCETPMSKE